MKDRPVRPPSVVGGQVSEEGMNINRTPSSRVIPRHPPSFPPAPPDRDRVDDTDRDRNRYGRR